MWIATQFSIFMVNKPGVLAQALGEFGRAKDHINVSYVYCTAGAKGGRTTGVLKVSELKKAMRVLDQGRKKPQRSSPGDRVPRSGAH